MQKLQFMHKHQQKNRTKNQLRHLIKTRSSADADKLALHGERSVEVTKHSTIPYVRYSFLK